jgi:CheY-like chemotaxis protein
MTEEVMEHLFEPFFTTKPKEKGTGLGLATIYGEVKQHKGFIDVESEAGMGTVFKIYFPCIAVAQDMRHTEIPSSVSLEGTETILLVEDNPMVLEFSLQALKSLGYRVIHASTSEDAIRLADYHRGDIDILVSDVVLPGMNGKLLAHELTLRRPGLKVLFTSGYTEDLLGQHGILEEGLHFISKPYTAAALAMKIREVLNLGECIHASSQSAFSS